MKLIKRNNSAGDSSGNSGMVPLRDAVNHLFDESMWDPFGLMARDPFFNSFFGRGGMQMSTPAVDISESKKEFLIEADIPGYGSDDIEVELEGNTLMLRAQKSESSEEKDDKTYHVRERSQSYWERRFALPSNVNADKIECEIKDGQLKIHLPKSKEDSKRKIKVKVK